MLAVVGKNLSSHQPSALRSGLDEVYYSGSCDPTSVVVLQGVLCSILSCQSQSDRSAALGRCNVPDEAAQARRAVGVVNIVEQLTKGESQL